MKKEQIEAIERRMTQSTSAHQWAMALVSYLKAKAKEMGYDPTAIVLWSKKTSKEMGYGDAPMIVWEEGPYEWTMLTAGTQLESCAAGRFSDVSEIDLYRGNFFAEPWHTYSLSVYPT